MNILLVSLGSIGRRHLDNIRKIEPDARITIWRQPASEKVVPGADRVVSDLVSVLDSLPDAAFITGPASQHIEVGLQLARHGVHLFVEKPLSNRFEGTEVFIEECRKRRLVLMVGYVLRFCRSLQAVKSALVEGRIGRVLSVRAEVGQYLPDWRPQSDYRKTVSASAALGGGAVLELSHEIDYIRWLFGEVDAVTARIARLGDLEIDVEDTAEILLDLQSGVLASIHLDMLQRVPTRTCRIVGSEGVLVWDGIAHRVSLWTSRENRWIDIWQAGPSFDRNEMYVAEMQHFLDCVVGKAEPLVTGEDGLRVLQIVLAAKQSSQEKRTIDL